MNDIKLYEARNNYHGCLWMLVAMIILTISLSAIVITGMYAATDIMRTRSTVQIAQIATTGAVDMARLQAQDHITVACMQHSWFTSMTSCIRAGGVNGTEWAWWQWLLLTGAMWALIMVAAHFLQK